METGAIISLAALAISAAGLLLSQRRDTRRDAAASARLDAKLDGIATGVEDIRVESRLTRGRVDALTERVSLAEERCRSAHQRIDRLEANP